MIQYMVLYPKYFTYLQKRLSVNKSEIILVTLLSKISFIIIIKAIGTEAAMDQFFTNNKSNVVTSSRILYTPSSFARTSLLHLQEIGSLTAQKPHISSRSNLHSFLFFIVADGRGSLTYDGEEYALRQGDCIFIDCSKPYSHTTSEHHLWTLRWIHFYGGALPEIYRKYSERGGRPVFRPGAPELFNRAWEDLLAAAGSGDYIRDMKINEILSGLLTLLMAESWHPEEQSKLPPKKSIVLPVKEYLDKNFEMKISLDELAAHFYINKYYLIKTFKEQYGQSINSYLLNVRITKAKQLLRFTDLSVEQIGLECGLGAAHYFSSKFKEVEGVPPSVYRVQWQNGTKDKQRINR